MIRQALVRWLIAFLSVFLFACGDSFVEGPQEDSGASTTGDVRPITGPQADAAPDSAPTADASPALDASPPDASPVDASQDASGKDSAPTCTPLDSSKTVSCMGGQEPEGDYFVSCMFTHTPPIYCQAAQVPPECRCKETYTCECLIMYGDPCHTCGLALQSCTMDGGGPNVTCQ